MWESAATCLIFYYSTGKWAREVMFSEAQECAANGCRCQAKDLLLSLPPHPILRIFDQHPSIGELLPDAVRLGEVPRVLRRGAVGDQRFDLRVAQGSLELP